jgi:putative component of membrane protein insertase Oxa1/YidC/SpoIIIJ protein YidD
MRYFVIWMIQIYRRLMPSAHRKVCLFRESCSVYVERVARESGSVAAFCALIKRFRCCRPGYGFQFTDERDTWNLVCADGSRFSESEVAPHIAAEYYAIIQQMRTNVPKERRKKKAKL